MSRTYSFLFHFVFLLLMLILFYTFLLEKSIFFLLALSFINFFVLAVPYVENIIYGLLVGVDIVYILLYFLKFNDSSPLIFLIFFTMVYIFNRRRKKMEKQGELNKMIQVHIENMNFSLNEFNEQSKRLKQFISDGLEEIENNRKIYEIVKHLISKYEQIENGDIVKDILRQVFTDIKEVEFLKRKRNDVKEFGKRDYITKNEGAVYTIRILKRSTILCFSFSKAITDRDIRLILFLSDIISAIYENMQLINKLKELSIFDGLTGIYLRKQVEKMLQNEMIRSDYNQRPLTILMLDIDYFKRVNDTYGHLMGDYVLSGTGEIISSMIRKDIDFAGRYGGEEFLIVLPNTPCDNAFKVAERIREIFSRRRFTYKNKTINITVSIGIAQYKSGETMESFIKRADEALYRAKEKGRNRSEKNC